MIALTSSLAPRPGAALSLQALVRRAAVVGVAGAVPVCTLCMLVGRHDMAKGLAVGVLLGILNSLLLAQRLDRIISGAEGVDRLKAIFRSNRALRFTLVLGGAAAATRVQGLHVAGLVGGLGFFFVVSGVVYSRGVLQCWRSEEEQGA